MIRKDNRIVKISVLRELVPQRVHWFYCWAPRATSNCANSFASPSICVWIAASDFAGGLSNHSRSSQYNNEISGRIRVVSIAEKQSRNIVGEKLQLADHLTQIVDRGLMGMGGENANVRLLEVIPKEISHVTIFWDFLIAAVHRRKCCDATRYPRMGDVRDQVPAKPFVSSTAQFGYQIFLKAGLSGVVVADEYVCPIRKHVCSCLALRRFCATAHFLVVKMPTCHRAQTGKRLVSLSGNTTTQTSMANALNGSSLMIPTDRRAVE